MRGFKGIAAAWASVAEVEDGQETVAALEVLAVIATAVGWKALGGDVCSGCRCHGRGGGCHSCRARDTHGGTHREYSRNPRNDLFGVRCCVHGLTMHTDALRCSSCASTRVSPPTGPVQAPLSGYQPRDMPITHSALCSRLDTTSTSRPVKLVEYTASGGAAGYRHGAALGLPGFGGHLRALTKGRDFASPDWRLKPCAHVNDTVSSTTGTAVASGPVEPARSHPLHRRPQVTASQINPTHGSRSK